MKTLIVNLGPPGDVLRTTVLLRELDGEIYWLTKKSCKDVLNSKKIKKVYFIEEDNEEMKKDYFDLVLSLNEEMEALNVVSHLKYKKIIGVYLDENKKIDYTPESAYWFNMSLVSHLGKSKADELKKLNKKSFPQIFIEMIGKKWKGQEYDLGIDPKKDFTRGKIGLINVETGKWPNKLWSKYDSLALKLKNEGFQVKFLGMKPTIREHIEDINDCELVVCGDTLGLHAAIALKKKVVALFTCTSFEEIYDYGRVIKIISPLCFEYFYQREKNKELIDSISLETVYDNIKKLIKAPI